MYPLRFQPAFRRYIWGGRRLADVLSKLIGDQKAAESWEIVDHGDDQSVVQFGSFSGSSLHELVLAHGADLVGEKVWQQINSDQLPAALRQRFPLLLKFLDANRDLSVQVHPDDQMGATLSPPDLGKTEAWYVLHADPGAKVYAGLKQGVTKEKFAAAIQAGETESLLHAFEAKGRRLHFCGSRYDARDRGRAVGRRNPTSQQHHVSRVRLEPGRRRRQLAGTAYRSSLSGDEL